MPNGHLRLVEPPHIVCAFSRRPLRPKDEKVLLISKRLPDEVYVEQNIFVKWFANRFAIDGVCPGMLPAKGPYNTQWTFDIDRFIDVFGWFKGGSFFYELLKGDNTPRNECPIAA